MKNTPTNPSPTSPQFEVTMVILIVSLVQAEAVIRSRAASVRSARLDQRDPSQLYRCVFVPSAELLCENLPEPEV